MAQTQKNAADNPVVRQLNDIKRLLVLQLIASGVPAGLVAESLQVDAAIISRMVPARKIKRLRGSR